MGSAVAVPCEDLLAQAVRELWAGGAVAERSEFPSAFGGVPLVEAAQGEVGQGRAFGQGGGAGGDRGGAQPGVGGGGFGGDAAGSRLGAG
ncbi:MAG: hypothetical protein ACRDZO_12685 [Egibacteraceae bacterium]